MNMGTRPRLPCEGSTEPCTRFSISRDPGMSAAELSDCNVKRVHALLDLRFQGLRNDLRPGLSRASIPPTRAQAREVRKCGISI
jgi:hypothetical protein